MRIGIDIRNAASGSPGQQRYLWRLGAWLATRGHEVHFPTVLKQAADVDVPEGTTLHRLAGSTPEQLRDRIQELDLDVLLLNPERSRDYRLVRPNLLRTAYGTDQYRQKLRSFRAPLERLGRAALRAAPWTLRQRGMERAFYEDRAPAPQVIAQSSYMKGQILDTYDIPSGNVHVVHNGLDPNEFSPERRAEARDKARADWGIPHGRTCLLFVGHNYRLKGLWQLLEAMPSLLKTVGDLHLLVAGRGTGKSQRTRAEALIRRGGLEGRVTLAGSVYPPMPAYAAADVLLHLTWHDSFGFVVLEGMACGLPVVTTEYAGAAELIEDGRSGWIVDPSRPEHLAEALRTLADPGVRERMGAVAAPIARACTEEQNFARVEDVMRAAAEAESVPI